MAVKTIPVEVKRDYWAGKDDVFIDGKAVPEGERIPAGMKVDISEKSAARLVNSGVLAMVAPTGDDTVAG